MNNFEKLSVTIIVLCFAGLLLSVVESMIELKQEIQEFKKNNQQIHSENLKKSLKITSI